MRLFPRGIVLRKQQFPDHSILGKSLRLTMTAL